MILLLLKNTQPYRWITRFVVWWRTQLTAIINTICRNFEYWFVECTLRHRSYILWHVWLRGVSNTQAWFWFGWVAGFKCASTLAGDPNGFGSCSLRIVVLLQLLLPNVIAPSLEVFSVSCGEFCVHNRQVAVMKHRCFSKRIFSPKCQCFLISFALVFWMSI